MAGKRVVSGLLFLGLCAGCAGGDKGRALVVGDEGSAGTHVSGSAGHAGAGLGANDDAVPTRPDDDGTTARPGELAVEIEDERAIAVEVVTVSCKGECADVEAVARGGHPPYAYAWEDGSQRARRTLCPDASARFSVTATDQGLVSGEFVEPPATARASVSATVLACSDGGAPAPDAAITGDMVYWADWSAVTVGMPGSAAGTIRTPAGDVHVDYEGEVEVQSEANPNAGNNFQPETTYMSASVRNPPPTTGAIAVSGNSNMTQTIQFSSPVRDPVIAIWSLGFGSLGIASTWQFDSAPLVLSSGPSVSWPFSDVLTVMDRQLTGTEGNGVIQFTGTFTTISFTVPVPEPAPGYATFTVGVH